jgi:phage repressor protein C with HTH and peptisase S24 domain
MLTLGERIRYVRDNILKLNQADFARRLGFSRVATISDYEKNKRNPDITSLRKIAVAGGVTLEWLLTGNEPISAYDANGSSAVREKGGAAYSNDVVNINVYDISSSAKPEDFPDTEPIESMPVPRKDFKRGPLAIRVKGDSMSPTILDGATVGIDKNDRRLVSGGLYAVWLNYEGVTVKRVFVYPDRIILKPDNPSFPETTIPSTSLGEDFIIGKVVWLYQRY